MRVRAGIVVVLGVAALAGTAGDALAQAPGTYAGGLLPTAGVPPPGYRPSLLIALQPRGGGRIAVRFDTTIRCANLTLDLDGRRVAPFDGTTIRTSEALVQRFGRGQRLVYRWQLTGTVAGPQASGTLHLTGEYRGPGRRVRRCTRAPDRAWQARLADAPTGGPGAPLAGSTLVGATGQRLADRLPGSVVVRVTADGRRVSALWNAVAPCGRGPRELFANFTPPRPVQGSAVSSDERFTIRFTNEVLRYHATFTAAFTTDGATGTLRLRVSVFDRSGRRLRTRCDSLTRAWAALPAAGAAPPAAAAVTPRPGTWSLTMASDPGDFIGAGQSWAYATGSGRLAIATGFTVLELTLDVPNGPWELTFAAVRGQPLRTGVYPNAQRYPFHPEVPGMDITTDHRGCDAVAGQFIVDALTKDSAGVRTLTVRFEQHCDNGPALRGTFTFRAT